MTTRRDFLVQTANVAMVAGAYANAPASVTNSKPSSSSMSMKSYKVPNTDLVVSRLAFGTGMLGIDWHSSDFAAKTTRALRTAYEAGITLFDFADVYRAGQAETALRGLLAEVPGSRDRIVVQSKCGLRVPDSWNPGDPVNNFGLDLSRKHIVSAAEGSLKRLGTNHLDILLLHAPDPLVQPEEVAEAFDDLHRSGKVRYFGVCSHNIVQMELLRKFVRQPLVVNQVRLGLAYHSAIQDRSSYGALVDYCRVHNIQVQAFSPLKAGSIFDKPVLLSPPEDASLEIKRLGKTLADVATRHNTTPAAIMLAWLLRHPAGIVPIIGASKAEHIIENCHSDSIELTHDEWTALLRVSAANPIA